MFTDIKQEDTSAQAYSIFRPNQKDGGDAIEYATKMLGGESQLVNWVRVAGVDITHWIAEAMAILKINKENWCEADISRTAGEIALNTHGRNAVSAELISIMHWK